MRAVVMALCAVLAAQATITDFYVDSDYTGTHTGSQAQPWRSVGNTEWTSINAALVTGPVNVYLSGRNAGSDTEQFHSATGSGSVADLIDLTKRTDTGPYLLTIDGTKNYNTSDATPNWLPNTGTNRCRTARLLGQDSTHAKHSNIYLTGLHAVDTGNNKSVSINGDNWSVVNCEFEHSSFVSGGGPLCLLTPTADAAHEGSSAYALPCTNILVQSNIIHKSQGEALYVGGGGASAGAAGSGYPSHSDVRIWDNTIFDSGFWGDQGDGIDVKGGIEHLSIKRNHLYHIGSGASAICRPMVLQGLYQVVGDSREISRNWIHSNTNCEDAAIALVDTWGVQMGTLLANNLLSTNTRTGSSGTGVGINMFASTGTFSNVNNTIIASGYVGLYAAAGAHVYNRNNILANNNGGGSQMELSGSATVDSDYDIWVGSAVGFGGEGSHSFSSTTTALFTDYANGDFTLLTTAPAKNAGVTVAMVTDDFLGAFRPQGTGYDVGAYEYPDGPPPPPPILFDAVGGVTFGAGVKLGR